MVCICRPGERASSEGTDIYFLLVERASLGETVEYTSFPDYHCVSLFGEMCWGTNQGKVMFLASCLAAVVRRV